MNTGHRNLTALAVMLLLVNSLCGQVITLLHQGQSSFYYLPGTTLEDVVGLYAQDNDTIVLPGGPIDLDQTGDLFVTKPLVFIGAGVYPSATGVTNRTQIIGNSLDRFTVQAGGSGSEFHGIEFYSTPPDITNNNVTDLLFKHCEFTNSVSMSSSLVNGMNNIQFVQCILRGGLSGSGNSVQNVVVDHCIIDGSVTFSGISNTVAVNHCLIMGSSFIGTTTNNGVTFTNNIFTLTSAPTIAHISACYYNNLFAIQGGGTVNAAANACYAGNGNQQTPLTPNNVFVNIPDFDDFPANYAGDYRLATNSVAIGMGQGGYDVGIYSGAAGTEWKDEAIPFNPHWQLLNVPTATGTTGVLAPVQIQAEAQQN